METTGAPKNTRTLQQFAGLHAKGVFPYHPGSFKDVGVDLAFDESLEFQTNMVNAMSHYEHRERYSLRVSTTLWMIILYVVYFLVFAFPLLWSTLFFYFLYWLLTLGVAPVAVNLLLNWALVYVVVLMSARFCIKLAVVQVIKRLPEAWFTPAAHNSLMKSFTSAGLTVDGLICRPFANDGFDAMAVGATFSELLVGRFSLRSKIGFWVFLYSFYWILKKALEHQFSLLTKVFNLFRGILFILFIGFFAPHDLLSKLSYSCSYLLTLPMLVIDRKVEIFRTIRFLYAWFWINFYLFLFEVGFLTWRSTHLPDKKIRHGLRSFMNTGLARISTVVAATNLPAFIRGAPAKFTIDSLNDTMARLVEVGVLPVPTLASSDLTEEIANLPHSEFALGNMGFRAGMRQVKTFVDQDLASLSAMAETYMRSESYRTLQNEIESTSRYFATSDIDFPDLDIDELWKLVGVIYENSQIAPFSLIIRRWEKKYGLGPMWLDPTFHRARKISRRKAIQLMGGIVEFTKIWARVFEISPTLTPLAGVSVKGEALAPKKWTRDVVRTIISSPWVSYVMGTTFNLLPNHNFQYTQTPVKIGMPLNGANLSTLFARHSRLKYHAAGDFTAFDSTLRDNVLENIKKVRKYGFRNHKDYDAIAYLIDVNYDQVVNQLLGLSTTGGIYEKDKGLSTGHSSTGSDNSLALVTLWLAAWKEVTGLGASEFKFFCELSGYGDDHIISWSELVPPSWTWENITKVMNKWGVTLRLENGHPDTPGGLELLTFLSKGNRIPNSQDIKEFRECGIAIPARVIFHEKAKLLGKMAAPVRSMDRDYRIKRLLSYLELTAHHRDVYDKVVTAITNISARSNKKWVIPSYESILTRWYDPKTKAKWDVEAELGEHEVIVDGPLYSYGAVTIIDLVANALAVVPDILNPMVFNAGYLNLVFSALGDRILWPLLLLGQSNRTYSTEAITNLVKRTSYDFLLNGPIVSCPAADISPGGLILRHWVFHLLRKAPSRGRLSTAYFMALFAKFSTAAYLLNGRVHEEIRRPWPPVWNVLLVWVLSFMPDAPWLSWVTFLGLPNLSLLLDKIFMSLWANFFARMPPNFRDVSILLRNFWERGNRDAVLVTAPTGSGKSTSFVYFLTQEFNLSFDHFIVIEPRALLVERLAAYLSSSYAMKWVPVTHSCPFEASRHHIMTPAQVLIHSRLLGPKTLVVLDEAHVKESSYRLLLDILPRLRVALILATATPTQDLKDLAALHVPVRMASVWKVVDRRADPLDIVEDNQYRSWRHGYSRRVAELVASCPPTARVLIFVIDVEHAVQIASILPRNACVLSSQNRDVDLNARYFVTTSVADAGLTIPNVDVVITGTIARFVGLARGVDYNIIVKLDSDTLIQRRGRTGRTNNGVFIVVPHLTNWPEEPPKVYKMDDTLQAIDSGIPIESLVFTPQRVLDLISKDLIYSRERDFEVHTMIAYLKHVLKVTHNAKPMTIFDLEDTMGSTREVALVETFAGDVALGEPVKPSERWDQIISMLEPIVLKAAIDKVRPPVEWVCALFYCDPTQANPTAALQEYLTGRLKTSVHWERSMKKLIKTDRLMAGDNRPPAMKDIPFQPRVVRDPSRMAKSARYGGFSGFKEKPAEITETPAVIEPYFTTKFDPALFEI
jgi:hypothetical protein